MRTPPAAGKQALCRDESNEYQVVDAQHQFQQNKRAQSKPGRGVGQPGEIPDHEVSLNEKNGGRKERGGVAGIQPKKDASLLHRKVRIPLIRGIASVWSDNGTSSMTSL